MRKRMAAVAATGLLGATAVLMLTWKADPISAALPASALRLPALNDAATGEPVPHGVRRIYPYSVVPGGVYGHAELKRVIRTDNVVAIHYASFDADKAHAVVVDKPRAVHVSYRKGDKVYWTAHKVMLSPGETLLSDGSNEMRARCANRISDLPQYPVEAHRPAMAELDQPVEVDEGEQLALGPDGLPVSTDGEEGHRRPAGAHFPVYRSNAGASPGLPMDRTLAGASGSGAMGIGPLAALGMTGASSSMGSRPRPVSRGVSGAPAPAVPDPVAESGSGSSGGSSGSPVPPEAGAAPVAQPVGGTDGPSAPSAPDPTAPLPRDEQAAADPQPGSDPAPPATEPPAPALPPTGEPPGGGGLGGGSGDIAPTLPVDTGPLPGQPLPTSEPFIPPAKLDPAPPQTDTGQAAPTEVPEPGSLWLFGLALAAMGALRRRS